MPGYFIRFHLESRTAVYMRADRISAVLHTTSGAVVVCDGVQHALSENAIEVHTALRLLGFNFSDDRI